MGDATRGVSAILALVPVGLFQSLPQSSTTCWGKRRRDKICKRLKSRVAGFTSEAPEAGCMVVGPKWGRSDDELAERT
jgi:hypothetical protein